MKNRTMFFLLIFLFLNPISSLMAVSPSAVDVRGGVGHGGGEVENIAKSSAWFLNISSNSKAKTVQYCLEVSKNFSVSEVELDELIQGSIKQWIKYIENKKPPGNFIFAKEFKKIEKCGSEDLTIYFGVTNKRIDKARAKYNQPVGLVEKEFYDYSRLWSKGFIWVSSDRKYFRKSVYGKINFPQWENRGNLRAVLNHEIGHIFGNGHVRGTIMREDIYKLTYDDFILSQELSYKTKIDHSVELLRCVMCGDVVSKNYKIADTFSDLRGKELLFKELVARDPVGKVMVSVDSFFLYLKDQKSSYKFMYATSRYDENIISKDVLRYSYSEGVMFGENVSHSVLHGGLTYGLNNEKSTPIVIEKNIGTHPLIYKVLLRGMFVSLKFKSVY